MDKILLGILVGVAISAVALLAALGVWLARNYKVVLRYVETMPSTNVRIALTLLLVAATGARYLGAGVPSGNGWGEWLAFLAAMGGIDVLQFASKRMTAKPEMFAAALTKESTEPPTPPGVGATDPTEVK